MVSAARELTVGGERAAPLRLRLGWLRKPALIQSAALALLAALLMGPDYWRGGIYGALDIITVSLPWAALPDKLPWHNPLITDVAEQYLPWRQFFYETLRSGQWPLWNPYIFSGHPTFGSINEQIFYLPNALFAFLPAERSFGPLTWLHLTLAGVGARAFARLHVDDDAAASLAGVGAMLSGPMIAWLQYPALMSTIAWAGAIFWALELTLRRQRVGYALLAGLAVGMCLLAGMTQYSLYLLLLAQAYVVVRAFGAGRTAVVLAALAGLVGLGIGAVAYLPALELAPQAHRGQQTLDQLRESALPLSHLALYVLPNAFGSPVRGDYLGPVNYVEAASYLGLLPLLLGLVALATLPRGRAVALFAITSLGLGLLQFGWPPAARLVAALPPLNYFVLNRVVGLMPFVVGLVAAATYARLPTDQARTRVLRSTAIAAGTLLLAGAILWASRGQLSRPGPAEYGRQDLTLALGLCLLGGLALAARVWLPRRSPVAWLGPAILALDLLLFGAPYNTVVAANPAAGPPPEPLARVASGPMAPRTVGLQIERFVFGPDVGMLWHVPVPDGYVSQYLSRYRAFVAHATPEKPVPWLRMFTNMTTFSQARAPYLDLLGVRYVLTTPDPLVPDSLRPGGGPLSQPIFGPRTLGVGFNARQNGLNRIDVYPARAGATPPAWLALHLKRGADADEHLSYVRLDHPVLADGEPLTFYFNPIADSAGKPYYFYLDAPEASAESAFALRLDDEGQPRFNAYAVPLAGWRKLAEANETALYENPAALERAYVVYGVRQLDEDGFYAALDDGSLDPRRVAAVQAPPPAPFASLVGAPPVDRTPVEIVAADASSVELRTAPTRPGLMVVSNSWYDGWHARVDGVDAPVERVDGVFQGVYLAPGQHAIKLTFEPSSLRLGLLAAAGAIAVGVGALAVELWLRRRARTP